MSILLGIVLFYAGGATCRLIASVSANGAHWLPVLLVDAAAWPITAWWR